MTTRDPQRSPVAPSRRRTRSTTGAMTLVLLCAGVGPALAADDLTAPAAVRGMVTSADKTRVKLDWTNGSESDLAGYHVYRAATADGAYVKLTATPRSGSDYPDYAAPIGVRSHYKVTAVDRSGNESAPVEATGVRKDGVAPAAPTTLTGMRTEAGITLDWADNKEVDLGGYVVSRATSSGGTYTKLTPTALTASTFSDGTAAVGVSYFYRVTAVDLGGYASRTAGVAVLIPDTTAPAAVRSMVTTTTTSSVKLDWASNSESDLAGYHVYRASTVDGTYTRLTTTVRTSSDYTDSTAMAGVPSFYRVVAVDRTGNESVAVAVTATRKDATAPTAPRTLVATGTETAISLDWADNTETDLAGYVVSRAATAGGTYTVLTTTPLTPSEYVDTTAPAGATVHYRVTARDLSGNTSSTASASAALVDTTAPGVVDGVSAVPGDASVALTWDPSGASDLAGYHVYRATTGDPVALTATPVTAASFTDRTAQNGTTYTYTVVAVDKAGNAGSPSAKLSATPSDTTAPRTPATPTATGDADGVVLAWTSNTEADLAGYVVERADTAEGEYARLTATPLTAATYTDTTAPAGTPSFYRVVAVDTTGNASVASPTVSGTPVDIAPPAQPTGLAATGTVEHIELSWADNGEGDLAGYVVSRASTVGGTYTTLTESPIAGSAFTDTTAPAGATSYYRVIAVDTAGNTSSAAAAEAARVVEKSPVVGADVTVAQDGSGDYTTVAAALAAAPANASSPYVIGIRTGTYRELLSVTKPNITFRGATGNASDVVITYDNAAGTPKADGTGTLGTTGSATVQIRANNVTTTNLTIENSYRETGAANEQAVALKTVGDRLVFDNVRLLGDQDTLYVDSAAAGTLARSYFVNSYIEGDVDFVFGRGTAVFDRSTLHASTRGSASNNGYVVAPSTDKSLAYGYLVTDSTITSDAPAGTFHLGRPWQPSGDVNAIAQVVIRNTELPAAVKASPWTDMSTTFSWRNARFFEYQNTGAGAAVNADRPQLTDVEAGKYTKFTYLAGTDGWNPTGQTPPPPPADTTAPAAPSGLSLEAADSSLALDWAANGEADLAGYNLYRSTTATVALTAANKLNAALLATPGHTDRTAANGTSYTYVLTAVDKAGNESVASGAVTGTPAGVPLPAHDVLVAADGTGQYTTVQAALAAAPAGTAAKPTVIAVKPGTYREMIAIAKSYVRIIGTTGNAKDVVLTYDNAGGTTNPATGAIYGTGNSQSVLVSGSNVTVEDLTISNTFDEAAVVLAGGEQAVALKTTGDRLVFDNVRLLGNQDTLLADSPNAFTVARSYYVNSYIEGDVDFIFGRGTAVFQRTTIHALSRGSSSNNGYITAASTADQNPFGFLIVDSTVTSNAPAGTFSLGRPWRGWTDGTQIRNGVTHNSRGQVTIRNTALPAAIRTTQPWADMSPNLWTDGRFSEYQNTGAGATGTTNRPQLTDAQSASATPQAYLAGADGWNPTAG